jgi:hypothetical protein
MLVTVGILTLIAAGVGGTLVALLKCEPAFYAAGACPGDYDTREKASRVLTRLQDLKTDIRTKGDWGETFSADELNCFFAETMTANGTFVSLLPENFHDPRVAIEGDRIKLGFRYGEGLFSAIVWIELRASGRTHDRGNAIGAGFNCRSGPRLERRCDLVSTQGQSGGAVPLLSGSTATRVAGADAGNTRRADRGRGPDADRPASPDDDAAVTGVVSHGCIPVGLA